MKSKVHILAFVRKPELLNAALLIFRTIRTGFPTADIHVWGNALPVDAVPIVGQRAAAVGATFVNLPMTTHDMWIEKLIEVEPGPIWVCDTDVVFFSKMEGWFDRDKVSMAGRWEPDFWEPFTETVRVERLQPAVMWLDCPRLRSDIREYLALFPLPFGLTAQVPLVRQHFVPVRGGPPLFYDTMAGLWQAGIGQRFDHRLDHAFEHLHCSTYIDLIGQTIGDGKLEDVHKLIYIHPVKARLMRDTQADYYRRQHDALTKMGIRVEARPHGSRKIRR